jgi:hypothetical protein
VSVDLRHNYHAVRSFERSTDVTDKAGQNPMRRGDQPLRSTAPTEEPGQRFMVVDQSSGGVQDVDREAASDGRFKWTTGDKVAPFDAGPKPTKDDLAGHKDANFDTDAEISWKWTPGEESYKLVDGVAELDDAAALKWDAKADAPKEEIDEFAERFEVVEFVEVPEPFGDALRLDDQADALWATADPLLEPLDGADAFDAGADGALDF